MSTVTISAMELRDRLGDIFNRVRYGGERFVIERRGKPIAAIIGIEELERLERLELEHEAEVIRLAKIAAETEGVVPFDALVDRYEELHGEHLGSRINV